MHQSEFKRLENRRILSEGIFYPLPAKKTSTSKVGDEMRPLFHETKVKKSINL